MKCPYCAEVIQDEAVLCRFCSAKKINGQWSHAATSSPTMVSMFRGSVFTIRTAGLFFLGSAAFEGLAVRSPVTLFGDVREGPIAIVYHLGYAGLFLAMGVGLWSAMPWGFTVVFAGTVFFTLERCLYLMDSAGRKAETSNALDGLGTLIGGDGQELVAQAMTMTTLISILCWWGFAFYLWRRQDYFVR